MKGPVTKRHILYDSTKMRTWEEEGMGSYCLVGKQFQFYKMRRVLEMDGGDGYTT